MPVSWMPFERMYIARIVSVAAFENPESPCSALMPVHGPSTTSVTRRPSATMSGATASVTNSTTTTRMSPNTSAVPTGRPRNILMRAGQTV
jgi:hypothetical protein